MDAKPTRLTLEEVMKMDGSLQEREKLSPKMPVVSPARVKDVDWTAIQAAILGALADCQTIAPAGKADAKTRWHSLRTCLQRWKVPAAMRVRVCHIDHDTWQERVRPSAAAKRRARLEVQAQDRRAAQEAAAKAKHEQEVRDVRP